MSKLSGPRLLETVKTLFQSLLRMIIQISCQKMVYCSAVMDQLSLDIHLASTMMLMIFQKTLQPLILMRSMVATN